jgi:hypothetical protein
VVRTLLTATVDAAVAATWKIIMNHKLVPIVFLPLALWACDGGGDLSSNQLGAGFPSGPDTGHSCTLMGCPVSVRLTLAPGTSSYEIIKTLTVTACQNERCVEGSFASMALPAPGPGGGVGITLPNQEVSVSATVWGLDDGGFSITVAWNGWGSSIASGDVFTARLTSPDGTIAATTTKTPTFKTVTPNGPSCGPTCTVDVDL